MKWTTKAGVVANGSDQTKGNLSKRASNNDYHNEDRIMVWTRNMGKIAGTKTTYECGQNKAQTVLQGQLKAKNESKVPLGKYGCVAML